MSDFSDRVSQDLSDRKLSLRGVAKALNYDPGYLSRVLSGKQHPSENLVMALDKYLSCDGELIALAAIRQPEEAATIHRSSTEFEALELIRRVQATDVGPTTLDFLQTVFDELAMAYPKVPPAELLAQVQMNTGYVANLLTGKKTLTEHRRLLVLGAWFSLLGATLHIDLEQATPAVAWLKTASVMADEAGHAEIRAWCYETEAWRVLTAGDYRRALELSRAGQDIAPAGSSALIQATAQEGRARARLGAAREAYAAIERVQHLADNFDASEGPEHHYRYDPAKAVSYTATTLAWVGDPAAEDYAREIIARLAPSENVERWPRRVAAAKIDLALTLLKSDRLDEACDATRKALLSGKVVPSNRWRALEVVKAVEQKRLPEASDLREAFLDS